MIVKPTKSSLDFGVIVESLLANPESYVNFGEYWWTLKRMLADWVEENAGSQVDANLLRGRALPRPDLELDESEVYNFLDTFSCVEDFIDWISYVNPRLIWDERAGEEVSIEDLEWEESFL